MALLRIEGVNLAHCIDDTEDLSTRRGGSLMLLHACPKVQEQFKDDLTSVSTGASVGLFEVRSDRATAIAEKVRHWLQEHPTFRHATFVVDVGTAEDFQAAERQAVNANRWRQMQSLSFSPAGLVATASAACTIDAVRPGLHARQIQDQQHRVSTSVRDRRRVGIDQKQSFYELELLALRQDGAAEAGALPPHLRSTYTHEFEELAQRPEVSGDLLDGKLAIFYADGNRFGRHARNATSAKALSDWDKAVKRSRRLFLDTLVARAQSADHAHWRTPEGKLRLETLLWGGDEFMFVVPAWCGFELVRLFFDATADLHYPADARTDDSRLTHACGLVFCHQQAPISRISALAKALADQGKRDGKDHDSLNWLVLESFDHAGGDLAEYLKQRFPAVPVDWASLALRPDTLAALMAHLPELKPALPRSALVQAARLLAEGNPTQPLQGLLARNYRQVTADLMPDQVTRWQALWKALHPERPVWSGTPSSADLPAWVKLLETWDYVVEVTA